MELEKNTRQLRELIEAEAWDRLPEQYAQLHMQDVAAAFDDLDPAVVARALQELPRDRWALVFSYLSEDDQYPLLQQLDDEEGRFVLQHLSPEDRTPGHSVKLSTGGSWAIVAQSANGNRRKRHRTVHAERQHVLFDQFAG